MQKTFNFFYAFLLVLLGLGATLMAEDITLTTYYPAPYGAYDELTVTGNVGIGTTSPSSVAKLTVPYSDGTETVPAYLGYNPTGETIAVCGNVNASIWHGASKGALGYIKDGTFVAGVYASGSGNATYAAIFESGNVGIGTTNPQATLDVAGNIKATLSTVPGAANMRYNNGTREVGWNDVAELFDTNEEVEVDDLLVIDETSDIRLKKSHVPYDTKVAGIVSGAPAILFQGSQLEIAPKPGGFVKGTKPPVAVSGRVLCKVSIENGAIQRGDLLTSSSTSGHAMKATDRKKSFGAIVGKALESFQGGPNGEKTGKIMVLVTLQ